MTERQILDALAARYCSPSYAFLEHVADATGGRHSKTIDAVAMGLWPSRGIALHGFEVKCDRRDWLRELKDPAKAEGWRFDHFWLVASEGVAVTAEIPKLWGWLIVRPSGRLVVLKGAPEIKPRPLTRHMLAALMRKIHAATVEDDQLTRRYYEGIDAGRQEMQAHVDDAKRREQDVRDQLDVRIKRFETASGITFDSYEGGSSLGRMVAVAKMLDPSNVLNRVDRLDRGMQDLAVMLRDVRQLLTDVVQVEKEITL